MPLRHAPQASFGEYLGWHVAAAVPSPLPLGQVVNTTATTVVAGAGSATITPASMAFIIAGAQLVIYGGTGNAEEVNVTAVTPTTFTATFVNAHSPFAAPSAPTATGNTGTGSSFTIGQTANVAISYVTASGETLVSPNTLVTIGTTGNNIVVTLPAFPTWVTGANVYVSTTSGGATLNRVTAGSPTSSTSAGTVTVTAFPATGVVVPASNTAGYLITGKKGVLLGPIMFNNPGSGMTLTIYNGNPAPALLTQYANALPQYGTMAIIKENQTPFQFQLACDYGLYYAYTGTTPGDLTIHYHPSNL